MTSFYKLIFDYITDGCWTAEIKNPLSNFYFKDYSPYIFFDCVFNSEVKIL